MADSSEPGVDLFDYLDYRAFLSDYYAHAKRTRRGFSYRAFSKRAGLGSPNHLKRVMDGDRNLTPEMAERFAAAMQLEGETGDYFVQLVKLGQSKNSIERSRAYEQLTRFKAYRKRRKLDIANAAYHATWYIPVVRELAGRDDFDPDPQWIARRLLPPIKPAQAAKALETLLEIGLLHREEDGRVLQSEPLVTTGPEAHAVHIADYHRVMIAKAADSIDLVASEDRDISAVQLLVSDRGMPQLKEMIRRFRRELLEFAVTETKGTQVVQLNFQVFPMTKDPTLGRNK